MRGSGCELGERRSSRGARWDSPYYQRMSHVRKTTDGIEVNFADGTTCVVRAEDLTGREASEPLRAELSKDGYELRLVLEGHTVEIPWSEVRSRTDREFAYYLDTVQAEEEQKVGARIR